MLFSSHMVQMNLLFYERPTDPEDDVISVSNSGAFLTFAVSAAAKVLSVSEEAEKSMRVTWQPAPGNVVNYRLTYKPQVGGRQLATKTAGGTTTTVLRRLQPMTTYDIVVVPVYRQGEGKARQGVGTTRTLVYN